MSRTARPSAAAVKRRQCGQALDPRPASSAGVQHRAGAAHGRWRSLACAGLQRDHTERLGRNSRDAKAMNAASSAVPSRLAERTARARRPASSRKAGSPRLLFRRPLPRRIASRLFCGAERQRSGKTAAGSLVRMQAAGVADLPRLVRRARCRRALKASVYSAQASMGCRKRVSDPLRRPSASNSRYQSLAPRTLNNISGLTHQAG